MEDRGTASTPGDRFAGIGLLIAIASAMGEGERASGRLRSHHCSGVLTFLFALLGIVKFFPPVVTGSVLAIIGLSLLPEAAKQAVAVMGPDRAVRETSPMRQYAGIHRDISACSAASWRQLACFYHVIGHSSRGCWVTRIDQCEADAFGLVAIPIRRSTLWAQ